MISRRSSSEPTGASSRTIDTGRSRRLAGRQTPAGSARRKLLHALAECRVHGVQTDGDDESAAAANDVAEPASALSEIFRLPSTKAYQINDLFVYSSWPYSGLIQKYPRLPLIGYG